MLAKVAFYYDTYKKKQNKFAFMTLLNTTRSMNKKVHKFVFCVTN